MRAPTKHPTPTLLQHSTVLHHMPSAPKCSRAHRDDLLSGLWPLLPQPPPSSIISLLHRRPCTASAWSTGARRPAHSAGPPTNYKTMAYTSGSRCNHPNCTSHHPFCNFPPHHLQLPTTTPQARQERRSDYSSTVVHRQDGHTRATRGTDTGGNPGGGVLRMTLK